MLNKEKSLYKMILDNHIKKVVINPSYNEIENDIINNKEGLLGLNGSLMVDTGIYTGRSPQDKYFVEEEYSKDYLWWGPVNRKIDGAIYEKLYAKVVDYYINNDEIFTCEQLDIEKKFENGNVRRGVRGSASASGAAQRRKRAWTTSCRRSRYPTE